VPSGGCWRPPRSSGAGTASTRAASSACGSSARRSSGPPSARGQEDPSSDLGTPEGNRGSHTLSAPTGVGSAGGVGRGEGDVSQSQFLAAMVFNRVYDEDGFHMTSFQLMQVRPPEWSPKCKPTTNPHYTKHCT